MFLVFFYLKKKICQEYPCYKHFCLFIELYPSNCFLEVQFSGQVFGHLELQLCHQTALQYDRISLPPSNTVMGACLFTHLPILTVLNNFKIFANLAVQDYPIVLLICIS